MAVAAERVEAAPVTGRKRRIIIPVVVILVLAALIFGIPRLLYAMHHVSTDDAQIQGNITTISPRVKGQVTNVYVDENQFVRKGAKLVQLDDRDYKVALLQAQAAYEQAVSNLQAATTAVPQQSALTSAQTAQAQAGIANATSGVLNAQEKIATARSNLDAASANAVKAQHDVTRARELAGEGAISNSDLDAAQAAYTDAVSQRDAAAQGVVVAQAGLNQAQANVVASRAQLEQAQTGTQTTQIKSAQAAVSAAQVQAAAAALANAKLQESYTLITAPIDGVVSKKSVNVGDTVQTGQPLMAIADQKHLWVLANLKETQIRNVRVGQPVDIHVDAFPHVVFRGNVESLSPATGATFALIPPDNASGNFTKVVQRVPIRIAIDPSSDPQGLLRQGLSVEASIDTTNH
ncbi:MAG: HlyD family secretion protein [Candidatus Eremiobacteraeota bacterium]|nr:HlyD family secretion protein [Candidatus Eremiobacteraeota bacterium]